MGIDLGIVQLNEWGDVGVACSRFRTKINERNYYYENNTLVDAMQGGVEGGM